MQSILSVYGGCRELCLGVEPRLNLVKNFVQLLDKIQHNELSIMIFKAVEILATGYSYMPTDAIEEALNVILRAFKSIASKTPRACYNLGSAINLLHSFSSLVGHLVEYDDEYYSLLLKLKIVPDFICPLLQLTWNKIIFEELETGNRNNGELADRTNHVSITASTASFLKSYYDELFMLLSQFTTRRNILLDKLASPTLCNLYRAAISHDFSIFLQQKGTGATNTKAENIEILDVSAFSIKPCLAFLEKIVLHSHKHLETLLSLLLQILQDMRLSDQMYLILILECMSNIMVNARRGRSTFCKVYGFETCLSIMTRCLGDFKCSQNEENTNDSRKTQKKRLDNSDFVSTLVAKLLETFGTALHGPHPSNRRYLREKIHYHSIVQPIRLSGILQSNFAADIIDAFILLLCGDFTDMQGTRTTDIHFNMFRVSRIQEEEYNADVLTNYCEDFSLLMRSKTATSMNYNMLFIITKVVGDIKPKSLSILMMKQVLKLLKIAGPLSRENACNVGAVSWLLETVDVIEDDELLVSLVDIVCLSCKAWHQTLRNTAYAAVSKKYR